MFENLESLMDSFIDKKVPGYDCVIYKDGECIYRHHNGYVDLENKIPFKGNERHCIYSCSKVITCTAALQLYEKGLLGLEDKLSKYLPEFENMMVKTADGGVKKAENAITIRHLFTMSAGFNYDVWAEDLKELRKESNCPMREVMKCLAKRPLEFEPGTRWMYSLCHDVLAAVVEVASGEKFSEYVKKNIFDVAGMKDTTYNVPDNELDTVSMNYSYCEETNSVNPVGRDVQSFKLGSEYESGGAGCVATVDDYIRFLEALRTGKLIKRETIDLMKTNQLDEKQLKDYGYDKETNDYGYGLGVRCAMPGSKYDDFGWGGAAGAHLAIDMVNNVTMFYVQDVLNFPNRNRGDVFKTAIDEIVKM